MTPPPLRAEEAREWLRLATSDLRVAELPLLWHGLKYPLTHDIRQLLDICAPLDRTLDPALLAAVDLTQFAVRFRYPGQEQPSPEEARLRLLTEAMD
jgi:HEPN domain-containing protein